MRIVVIGGYGNFGARICRALSRHSEYQIVATGRDPDRGAQRADLNSRIALARLDLAATDFPARLKNLKPDLVIHCAGPFQGQDYRVACAAIDAGAHYIDLADGREFVARFAEKLDAATRTAGVFAVTGASTLPALSSAVIDSLIGRFQDLREVRITIAPGQKAPRGTATMAGVLSYAGLPIRWWSGGNWTKAYGWQNLNRIRFAKLGKRWAAACDVPDLELFPTRYPGIEIVEFRAALELGVQHLALWLLAGLRRVGLPLALERWAAPLNRASSYLDRFGSERGGMLVSLQGIKHDGRYGSVDWHLTADANHGPEIPCMAAILMTHKIARGEITARGAFPCMGFLSLAEFGPEFARWGITSAIEDDMA